MHAEEVLSTLGRDLPMAFNLASVLIATGIFLFVSVRLFEARDMVSE